MKTALDHIKDKFSSCNKVFSDSDFCQRIEGVSIRVVSNDGISAVEINSILTLWRISPKYYNLSGKQHALGVLDTEAPMHINSR